MCVCGGGGWSAHVLTRIYWGEEPQAFIFRREMHEQIQYFHCFPLFPASQSMSKESTCHSTGKVSGTGERGGAPPTERRSRDSGHPGAPDRAWDLLPAAAPASPLGGCPGITGNRQNCCQRWVQTHVSLTPCPHPRELVPSHGQNTWACTHHKGHEGQSWSRTPRRTETVFPGFQLLNRVPRPAKLRFA